MDAAVAKHIESTPDLSGGRPRIAGTRVRVQDIVACHEFQGMTPDEIVAGYPQISLAAVYAALSYYHEHRDEIRAHMRADEARAAQFRADRRSGGVDAGSLPSR